MSTGGAVRCLRFLPLVSVLWLAPSSAIGAEHDEDTYRTLVQPVKAGDRTVDFRALRLACMKSTHCEPRGSPADLAVLNAKDLHKVVEMAEKLIEGGFVNIEAHATAAAAYAKLNEQRWDVQNPKTGQNVVVFFNLDAFSAKSHVRDT